MEETKLQEIQEITENTETPETQEAPDNTENTETPTDPETPEIQETPVKKKKKKRAGKKKLKQFIVTGLLAIAALVCLLIVMYLTNVDYRFVRAFNNGISESWALENNGMQISESSGPKDTGFIDVEYQAVKGFKHAKFKNKELGALAAKYIAALEGCRAAIKKNDPDKDYDTFWNGFSQSYGQRLEAIYDLYMGDFGIELDDPENPVHEKEIDELRFATWSIRKTADIKFTRVKADKNEDLGEDPNTILAAKVRNDSGFDLEYINIDVELYDEKGELIETVTAYAEDIKNNEDFELKCYQTEETKAEAYKITSVICHRKGDTQAAND